MPQRLPFLLTWAVCTAIVVTAAPRQQPDSRDIDSILTAASNLASGTNDTYALSRYQDLLRVSPEMRARLIRFYDTEKAPRGRSSRFLNPFEIFCKNFEAVQYACHEAGKMENCPLGVNSFMDMSREEFATTHFGLSNASKSASWGEELHGLWRPAHNLRAGSSDWRGKGVLTPVKNQGSCGSCWAFAAAEQMESDYAIASARLLELSPQQLLATTYGWSGSPAHESYSNGCNGGHTWQAVAAAFAMGGVLNETTLPYEGSATPVDDKVGRMLSKREKLVLKLDPGTAKQFRSVSDVISYALWDYQAGMIDMLHDGPIMTHMDATCFEYVHGAGKSWTGSYSMSRDGPLTRDICKSIHRYYGTTPAINHAVQIVAYNLEGDYFVVRNSWGSSWGDGGYVSIKADACLIVSKYVWQTHMPVSPTSSLRPSACSCTSFCPGSFLGSVFGTSKNGWFCFSQCCPAAALRDVLTNMVLSTAIPGGLLPSPPDSSNYDTTAALLVDAFRQADLDKLAEGLVTYFGKIDPTYLSWSNAETEANWLTRLIHRDRRAQAIRVNHLANSARQIILSGPGLIESETKRSRLIAQLREVALATADEGYESGACDCTWTETWTCPGSSLFVKPGLKPMRAKDQTTIWHEDVCFYFCCGPNDDTARREARACIEQRNADAEKYHDSLHGILFYLIMTPIVIVLFLICVAISLVTYPVRVCMCDEEASLLLF